MKKQSEQKVTINGFNEKDTWTLYKTAKIKKLQPDETLIRQGDTVKDLYIILKGKMAAFNNSNTPMLLNNGGWINASGFIKQTPSRISVRAVEPSSIMILNENIINSLDANIQKLFYKHLNKIIVNDLNRCELIAKEYAETNIRLIKDIYQKCTKGNADLKKSELIQNILKKIPKLPAFAINLVNDLMNKNISFDKISEQIAKDPSLTSIILKRVNSSFYGFHKKISDIHHATVLLGINQLYQLLIAEGIRTTMPDHPSFKEIHLNCVSISHIAFTLSMKTNIAKPVELSTIGLLHNLGQIVILLLKQQNPGIATLIDKLDMAQVGGLLLESWNIPDTIWTTIKYQCFPEFSLPNNIPEDIRNNVALIYMSRICYEIFSGRPKQELPTTFIKQYLRILGLEKYSPDKIAFNIIRPALETKAKVLPVHLKKLIGMDDLQ